MPLVRASVEVAALLSVIWWALTRGAIMASRTGAGGRPPAWQSAAADAGAVFMFGVIVLVLEWRDMAAFAAGSSSRWLLVLSPAPAYFYLAWRFAGWRWNRRTDPSEPIRLHLKPDSPLSWAVYIWFAAWVCWQIAHGFAPWLLPSWLS